MEHLKFPIGPFAPKNSFSEQEFQEIINIIQNAPSKYRNLVQNLTEQELQKSYREGAWSIKQLVHHVADMQMLHFTRLKMAITDPENTELLLVKIDDWTKTHEANHGEIEDSLKMFEGIHHRFAMLAAQLDDTILSKIMYHAGRKIHINLKQLLQMSAWHVEHHLAHINIALGK